MFKKQLALHGLIPSVMAVFDLANNHGYINTSEFKLTTNDISDKTARADYDLESRIEEAGLVWDNDLKEYVPKED